MNRSGGDEERQSAVSPRTSRIPEIAVVTKSVQALPRDRAAVRQRLDQRSEPRVRVETAMTVASLSVGFSILMALWKLALGVPTGSVFLIMVGCCNLAVASAKHLVVRSYQTDRLGGDARMPRLAAVSKNTGQIVAGFGILFIAASVPLTAGIVAPADYRPSTALIVAAAALIELGWALPGSVFIRDRTPAPMRLLKRINLVTGIVLLPLMVAAALSPFDPVLAERLGGVLGIACGLASCTIGVLLITHPPRRRGFGEGIDVPADR